MSGVGGVGGATLCTPHVRVFVRRVTVFEWLSYFRALTTDKLRKLLSADHSPLAPGTLSSS